VRVLLDRYYVVCAGRRGVALLGGDACALDLPENSVDAVVTDPPAAIGFMGHEWDGDRGGRDGWSRWLAEQLAPSVRALRPGGHVLAWALPRTSHWTSTALEIAGLEIRDTVHDLLCLDDAVAALVASLDARQRAALLRVVEGGGPASAIFYQIFGQGFPKSLTSASAEIPEWSGTALKPAAEHWILARKPPGDSIAATYAEHGTGVLNIGGCRIGTDLVGGGASFGSAWHEGSGLGKSYEPKPVIGRWPAHLTLDERAAAALDTQSPEIRLGGRRGQAGVKLGYKGGARGYESEPIPPSTGGPSRFFYVAKPSRKEKERGLDHLDPSTGGEATGRTDGSAGVANPRAGAGRTGGARNVHPTVKSVELMRWLVRLVTPPGGVVLDPFAGSGTTALAAIAEGLSFVGVEQGGPCSVCGKEGACVGDEHERAPKYHPILVGRVEDALAGVGGE
jgi:hypothetical protein